MRSVLRLSFRNLVSNRTRFALTTFSVLVGVAFVVASFVLSDGLRSTFNTIVQDANANIDAQVRAASGFDEVDFGLTNFDEEILETVLAVEGVAEAQPGMQTDQVMPITADGEPLESFGPPILSFNWVDSRLSPMSIVAGNAPTGPGQFVIDVGTADREGFELGESYDVVGRDGRESFTLVGISRFGEDNAVAGAALLSFTLDELWRLNGSQGLLNWIDVAAADDVTPQELVARLDAALPEGMEAVGGDVVIDEGQEDFGAIIDIFGTILLAFALVSVFVSAFIIANTFNILLGQRVRQLALLRALGASSRQVRMSALFEAGIVGLVASALGLVLGAFLALGLRGLMNSFGMSLPDFGIVIAGRTVIVALLVGIGVTLLAALAPARRAARVPPVAAMRDGYRLGAGEGARRTAIGGTMLAVGLAAIAWSLFGDPGGALLISALLGGGAVLVFVSVNMLAPLFASPAARFLGAPLEHMVWLGVTGHMARENAARDSKRTSRTAAGLMIGLALISMATVVASSLKESFRSSLGSTLVADYLVTTGPSGSGFTPGLVDDVQALREFGDVSAVRYGRVRIDGDEKGIAATDLTLVGSLLELDVLSGDPGEPRDKPVVALTEQVAEEQDLSVGDSLTIEFAQTGNQEFEVGAIYDNDFLIGHYIIDLSTWDENFAVGQDNVIAAKLAPGFDLTDASEALAPLEESFPQLEFETRDEFGDRLESQLDTLLIIINVFLGLAIVIALMGITNTMALSVLERTREIGLMRAVGMTRRQTRMMIRWEAGVVSLFGALLGVGVGIVFGWIAVTAIPDSIVSDLAVPVPTLVIYVVVATLAGLLAAWLPARRAARLHILDAIQQL